MVDVYAIDQVLPQTQCEQCGYKGCMKYAEAIANGEKINRCPPGGEDGIRTLAKLLDRAYEPLNKECGVHVAFERAQIDQNSCIGCRLCADVCPTDAIIGARRHEHSVDLDLCTGCCLCQIACPMDCISMQQAGFEWSSEMAAKARILTNQKKQRLAKQAEQKELQLTQSSSESKKKALLSSLLKDLT